MNDSADIKNAAKKLQSALVKLEVALSPILRNISRLEAIESESESFKADRAALASKLDVAKDRENTFKKREADFAALSDETISELDRVIRQVNTALTKDNRGSKG